MTAPSIGARIGGADDSADRRRVPRVDIALEGRVRELGASGVDATVLNVSETGFMAQCDELFEVGARIWLMLPGRDRANAVVRWVAGDRLGAEFAEPISLDGLEPS